jgi:hypothetical protein
MRNISSRITTLLSIAVLATSLNACVKDPTKTDVASTGDHMMVVYANPNHAFAVDETKGITGDSVKSFVMSEIYSKALVEQQPFSSHTGRVEMHCDKNEFVVVTQFRIAKGTGAILGEDKDVEGQVHVFKPESSVAAMIQAFVCKDYTGPKVAPTPPKTEDTTV